MVRKRKTRKNYEITKNWKCEKMKHEQKLSEIKRNFELEVKEQEPLTIGIATGTIDWKTE